MSTRLSRFNSFHTTLTETSFLTPPPPFTPAAALASSFSKRQQYRGVSFSRRQTSRATRWPPASGATTAFGRVGRHRRPRAPPLLQHGRHRRPCVRHQPPPTLEVAWEERVTGSADVCSICRVEHFFFLILLP